MRLANIEDRRSAIRVEGRIGFVIGEAEAAIRKIDPQSALKSGTAANDGAEAVGRRLEILDEPRGEDGGVAAKVLSANDVGNDQIRQGQALRHESLLFSLDKDC